VSAPDESLEQIENASGPSLSQQRTTSQSHFALLEPMRAENSPSLPNFPRIAVSIARSAACGTHCRSRVQSNGQSSRWLASGVLARCARWSTSACRSMTSLNVAAVVQADLATTWDALMAGDVNAVGRRYWTCGVWSGPHVLVEGVIDLVRAMAERSHERSLTAGQKALIIQTTIFDKRAYDTGLRDAMRMVIDEFTLAYPGIKNVEHEYFYAVHGADDATRQGYLTRAYALGRQF
jgi:hypothetical protein